MAVRNAYYLLMVLTISTFFKISTRVEAIGVCYGTIADNLPPPPEVVALFKSNQIDSMRIYSPNHDILAALAGGIALTIGTFNSEVQAMAADPAAAQGWVAANILPYVNTVNFRYINVGNEIIPDALAPFILPAMTNVQNALVASGVTTIKVSTSIASNVLGPSFPPSNGHFTPEAEAILSPILQFLAAHGAPLLINIYPYYAYRGNPENVRLDYALFNATGVVEQDGQLGYQNLFDAMVDSIVAAMEKVGAGNVGLVVSESGWPSNGAFGASADNARVHNQNLIDHVGKGTPRRPGVPLETYLFAMFNENQKGPAELEKFYGLFFPDKTPVYPIRFVA
ncbi:glucan endo-1,3-beta-glucosidase-like [Curcuma longa]|uniref:glucan endo-1,3-beta-glucosidase-like n=1 Tax=Curcuma longa TaxID=136217 RepID=UPI003D9F288F